MYERVGRLYPIYDHACVATAEFIEKDTDISLRSSSAIRKLGAPRPFVANVRRKPRIFLGFKFFEVERHRINSSFAQMINTALRRASFLIHLRIRPIFGRFARPE